jgi:hypothetical protein
MGIAGVRVKKRKARKREGRSMSGDKKTIKNRKEDGKKGRKTIENRIKEGGDEKETKGKRKYNQVKKKRKLHSREIAFI